MITDYNLHILNYLSFCINGFVFKGRPRDCLIYVLFAIDREHVNKIITKNIIMSVTKKLKILDAHIWISISLFLSLNVSTKCFTSSLFFSFKALGWIDDFPVLTSKSFSYIWCEFSGPVDTRNGLITFNVIIKFFLRLAPREDPG